MANSTTNYGLTKPLADDFYDVQVQNDNMDIIDGELKKKYDPNNKPTAVDVGAIPTIPKYYSPDTNMSADDLLDPLALIPVSTTINAELYSIVRGTFAYVLTIFYISASATNRRMQLAFSYHGEPHKIAYRNYTTIGWTSWKEIADTDYAVDKTGDTMTGNLTVYREDSPSFLLQSAGNSIAVFRKNASASVDYGTNLEDTGAKGGVAALNVLGDNTLDKAVAVSKDGILYYLYGEHNATKSSIATAVVG